MMSRDSIFKTCSTLPISRFHFALLVFQNRMAKLADKDIVINAFVIGVSRGDRKNFAKEKIPESSTLAAGKRILVWVVTLLLIILPQPSLSPKSHAQPGPIKKFPWMIKNPFSSNNGLNLHIQLDDSA